MIPADMLKTMRDIQQATLKAQTRTGNGAIGTQIKAGKYRVALCTYRKNGTSDITALSEYMSAAEVINFLNNL